MNTFHSESHELSKTSLLQALIFSVSMTTAGCVSAPKVPVRDVRVDGNTTIVIEWCYNAPTRAYEKRVYKNGKLVSRESSVYYGGNYNSQKNNGALCPNIDGVQYISK